ncbi:MAG: 3-hydroxyacyl-CoA dehydrogenase family protein, partial [Mycobacteriales bacterium]
LMPLCEVVRGEHTADSAVARAVAFAEQLGKTTVVVRKDVAGFVTTRLVVALVMEAVRLVEAGVATPEDIDTACRLGFGHRMGPLATCDLTGADVLRAATNVIHAESGQDTFAVPELLNRMVAAGELGRKTGRGFYDYNAH